MKVCQTFRNKKGTRDNREGKQDAKELMGCADNKTQGRPTVKRIRQSRVMTDRKRASNKRCPLRRKKYGSSNQKLSN